MNDLGLSPAGMLGVAVVIGMVCALICASVAPGKGRDAGLWAVLGFLLGIIGVIIIACLSPIRRPTAGLVRDQRRNALLGRTTVALMNAARSLYEMRELPSPSARPGPASSRIVRPSRQSTLRPDSRWGPS